MKLNLTHAQLIDIFAARFVGTLAEFRAVKAWPFLD
jgi:hypothetical protein